MIRYLSQKDSSKCCGCKACENICPTRAIAFQQDEEGFQYPTLIVEKCISCDACSKVCPYENEVKRFDPLSIYAFQTKNEAILAQSSSGGVFRTLADYVLSNNGWIVGCVIDDRGKAFLQISNQIEDIEKMMGSKYVYSDPGTIYSQVKSKLINNELVLFTGSPCQCAAIKSFLKKEFHNLITADFLCHGMPSELALRAYMQSKDRPISKIKFRDKRAKGWGMVISYEQDGKRKYSIEQTDSYLYAFQHGFLNRYSCYSCPFTGEKRFTDFTFCDFWGIETVHKEFNLSKGVSALSINSEKAVSIWREIQDKSVFVVTNRDDVAVGNPAIKTMVKDESYPVLRKTIYKEIKQNGWKKCERAHFRPRHYALKKMWYRLPRKLINMIKKALY